MPRAGLDPATVVTTAARLADEDGLDQLTLARLAAELGIRAPSLYAHVSGLEDLRRRVRALGAREMTDQLADAAAGRAGRDALHAVAIAYREFARRRPGVYDAMQRAPEPGDDPGDAEATRLLALLAAVLRGYGLEGDDATHGIRLMRSSLHGFVALEAGGGFALPLPLDESFERLIEMLDRGLRGSATTG
jgi:AcrR family transcriptional regulator